MDGWERAFVLHGRPYSETSLMLDLFTEGHGRVRLLAKGARSRRSNLKGCLQPFTPLLVRWGGRGEVKTLRNAEAVSLGMSAAGAGRIEKWWVPPRVNPGGYGGGIDRRRVPGQRHPDR